MACPTSPWNLQLFSVGGDHTLPLGTGLSGNAGKDAYQIFNTGTSDREACTCLAAAPSGAPVVGGTASQASWCQIHRIQTAKVRSLQSYRASCMACETQHPCQISAGLCRGRVRSGWLEDNLRVTSPMTAHVLASVYGLVRARFASRT